MATRPLPVWFDRDDVVQSHGAHMYTNLLEEQYQVKERMAKDPNLENDVGMQEYLRRLMMMHSTIDTALLSAVHRSNHQRYLYNGFEENYHMSNDLEEVEFRSDQSDSSQDYEEEEEDEESQSSDAEAAAAAAKKATAAQDARQRKKEEAKKRRVEDAMLLVKEKKVRDDKGNLIPTVGPFPAPRVTLRSAKPGQLFASRKSLTTRTTIVKEEEEEDRDEFVPATQGPSGEYDVTAHLASCLQPLSSDSLKKISESAKLNLRPSSTNEEFIGSIVKTAARLGCEKACLLMDKHKIIDAVANYCHASRPDVMAHMGTNVDFLNSLPDDLRKMLGPVLGMPKENCSVGEMWERIVAMGFCTVLTNLRLRPLRRIAQELSIQLKETASTEKYGEAIVYTAFPRERLRAKQSKNVKKNTDVQFSVLQAQVRSVGDMGFISFVVHNISTMRRDTERHYSPEFEFGNLRWSILCMANKDSLALYLCQTGTVHCKFVISVVNTNPDESICNEGTQRFSSASTENDWGFNNVVKFDTLLDPAMGFWSPETDSITVEIGLVFVESVKAPPPAKVAANPRAEKKKVAEIPMETPELQKLLEEEAIGDRKKRWKAEQNKFYKDEERLRKELMEKQRKAWSQLSDQGTSERNRIIKAEKEKERREQAERKREEERARQIQEAMVELTARQAELTEEVADVNNKKKAVLAEVKDLKRDVDAAKHELSTIDGSIGTLQKQIEDFEKKIKRNKQRINDARAKTRSPLPELPPELSDSSDAESEEEDTATPATAAAPMNGNGSSSTLPGKGRSLSHDDDLHLDAVDESELMRTLQQSLASIIGQ